MPADPKIVELLTHIQAEKPEMERLAHFAILDYQSQSLALLAAHLPPAELSRSLDHAKALLHGKLANIIDPLGLPESQADIERAADRNAGTGLNHLLLRMMVAAFVSCWDDVKIIGFINARQERVPELLGIVERLREYVAYDAMLQDK